jgi:cytoskeletal protein RodZ
MEESLGQHLKRMRTDKRHSLRDISMKTCIGYYHLEALEADNFEKLPAHTVTKSYVRTYARFLRLDEVDIMRRFAESA